MIIGANSVLFGGFDLETAFKYIAACAYDGIELSASEGKSQHMVLGRWREIAPQARELAKKYNLPILAMEQPKQDPDIMEQAFQAAVEIGIPVINCGPGGKSGDEASFQQSIYSLGKLADRAQHYGRMLCVKAHVGAAIYNTPTTLRMLKAITSPAFGLNMDPSHIHRANENPVDALAAVVKWVKHVHVRDCKGRQKSPGPPATQANGRGDIDLLGYIRVLHENGYRGPIDLEVIGATDLELPLCIAIAAESRGHMQACLQACKAR